MKKLLAKILLLILLVNCQNTSVDKIPENLEFDIRKYLVSEELLYILDTEIDNHKINIDSIIEYPKYKYLENELDTYNSTYKILEKGNALGKYQAMNTTQERIDSINGIYKKTTKTDNIFKCYTTLQMKSDSLKTYNLTIFLDEKYKVINHDLFDINYLKLEDELEIE